MTNFQRVNDAFGRAMAGSNESTNRAMGRKLLAFDFDAYHDAPIVEFDLVKVDGVVVEVYGDGTCEVELFPVSNAVCNVMTFSADQLAKA